MEKTEYRLESNGYVNFLQYKVIKKNWFRTKIVWEYVWYPYYDKIHGRSLDSCGYNNFINGYNYRNLENFPKKYPNIKKYFEWAEQEQQKLIVKAEKWREEKDARTGIITNI